MTPEEKAEIEACLDLIGDETPSPRLRARVMAGIATTESAPRLPSLSWSWRVAAALLLTVSAMGWLLLYGHALKPSPAGQASVETAAAEASFPTGILGNPQAPQAYLAPGVDLLIQAGTRAASTPDHRLRLESGTLWLTASGSGRPQVLEMAGATLTLRQGSVAARCPEPANAAWNLLMGEATAAETPAAEVWVLDGEAEWTLGKSTHAVRAGSKLTLGTEASPSACSESSFSRAEAEALTRARVSVVASLQGSPLLPSGPRQAGTNVFAEGASAVPPTYRWVTVLNRRDAATEVGLTLGVDGAWRQWVVGMASSPPAAEEIIEVDWDGRQLTGLLNGRLMLSATREDLKGALLPAERASWGVSVWGGKVSILRSTLHP